MDINFGDLVVQIAITIAVVDFVKFACKDKLGYYAILIAFVVGFAITILGILPAQIDWLFVVKNTITIGLAAAGVYKVVTKIASNEK
jgi:hypothetical protein